MKYLPRVATPLLLFLLLQGCAGIRKPIDPRVNFHASMVQAVLAAAETREEVLKAVGRADRAGIVGSDFVDDAIYRGDLAKIAIDEAQSVLAVYLRAGGSQEPIFAALMAVSAALVDLTDILIPEGP